MSGWDVLAGGVLQASIAGHIFYYGCVIVCVGGLRTYSVGCVLQLDCIHMSTNLRMYSILQNTTTM